MGAWTASVPAVAFADTTDSNATTTSSLTATKSVMVCCQAHTRSGQ